MLKNWQNSIKMTTTHQKIKNLHLLQKRAKTVNHRRQKRKKKAAITIIKIHRHQNQAQSQRDILHRVHDHDHGHAQDQEIAIGEVIGKIIEIIIDGHAAGHDQIHRHTLDHAVDQNHGHTHDHIHAHDRDRAVYHILHRLDQVEVARDHVLEIVNNENAKENVIEDEGEEVTVNRVILVRAAAVAQDQTVKVVADHGQDQRVCRLNKAYHRVHCHHHAKYIHIHREVPIKRV